MDPYYKNINKNTEFISAVRIFAINHTLIIICDRVIYLMVRIITRSKKVKTQRKKIVI